MTTLPRLAPFFVVIGSVAGCFDVSPSGPTPILIDSFDNGDVLPADHHFDQWRCGQVDPNIPGDCQCDYDPANYHSAPYSMRLHAHVTETGSDKRVGAQLYTQAYVAEDLSNMHELVFSARYDIGDPPLPIDARLWVELWCSSANNYVHWSVPNWQSNQWQTNVLDLSRFDSPWPEIEGGRSACLERVDSIHFSVNAGLGKGQQGTFDLHIDDVYFR